MRALVTGGAGFIGSHLVERLADAGQQVLVLDDLSTGSRENLPAGDGRVELTVGSILDEELVDRSTARVDTVFHLAAAVGVKTILDDPLGAMRTNLRGTEHVLEAARKHGARVMITSTSEVYGLNTADALSEDSVRMMGSPLKTRWSYAEAKAIDETLAYAYWRYMNVPTVIIRPFNVVGPRQTGRYGMVVPRFVTQALRGQPLTVHGDGTQTRCFCHVAEAVDAMVTLVDQPEAYGQVFNIGRREEISIADLARRVIEMSESTSEIHYVPYEVAYPEGFEDMQRRVPDLAKVRDLIGFQPVLGLDDILRDLIEEKTGVASDLLGDLPGAVVSASAAGLVARANLAS